METPIPRILLALEGKTDFLKSQGVAIANEVGRLFGGGEEDGKTLKARDKPPTDKERAEVAKGLRAMLGRKGKAG